ncbi:FG-GAP repeat domain-containing protein [Roseibacillus persicicus]|uniref:FG-GAP repeat domain-containing protein n=1 Tax=Roseibacillus persicicus TaxID=454148 RepID=UPI00280EE6ED|nr:VCBS repeat-containing protein [Roseibacillus persicicus]MDQ8189450.1 VCBS repeat-containing protein [Roseibacillus persicicus]
MNRLFTFWFSAQFALAPLLSAQSEVRFDALTINLTVNEGGELRLLDLDNDGDEDLVSVSNNSNSNVNRISYYLERLPDGSFGEPKLLLLNNRSNAQGSVALRDCNGDGWLDPMRVVSEEYAFNQYRLVLETYHSDGEGTYSREPSESLIFPRSGTASSDGKQLYLLFTRQASDEDNTQILEITNATPGDEFGKILASSPLAYGIYQLALDEAVWGNFDGQGQPDLAIPADQGKVIIWTRDSAFAAAPSWDSAFQSSNRPLRVDDLDGDGLDDLWVSEFQVSDTDLELLIRRSDGESFHNYGSIDSPLLDEATILGATPSGENQAATILLLQLDRASQSWHLASLQFEDELRNPTSPQARVEIQEEAFMPYSIHRGTTSFLDAGFRTSPMVGDDGVTFYLKFNSDGRRYLETGYHLAKVHWSPEDIHTSYEIISPPSFSSPQFLPEDLNGDSFPDLVIGPDVLGAYWVRINDGGGGFGSWQELDLIPERYLAEFPSLEINNMVMGDVNGDGEPDFVIDYLVPDPLSAGNDRAVCVTALNQGELLLEHPAELPEFFISGILARETCAVALVDWDQDGDLDMIDSSVGWRENDGQGNFSSSSRNLASPGVPVSDAFGNVTLSPTALSFGDIDGNGFPDLYSSLAGAEYEFGAFTGTYGVVVLNRFPQSPSAPIKVPISVASSDAFGNPVFLRGTGLADLNLDGLADIFGPDVSRNAYGNPSIIGRVLVYSQGETNPLPAELFEVPSRTPSFHPEFHDFNGDGLLEFCSLTGYLAPSTHGPESSAEYNFTNDYPLQEETGALADFDGDGDVDFIVRDDFFGPSSYLLLRNPIVDDSSLLTFEMIRRGVKGSAANPDSDADGDGVSNFVEFINGSDPQDASSHTTTEPALILSADRVPEFRVNKAAKNLGVSYRLEFCTDLAHWTEAPAELHSALDSEWDLYRLSGDSFPAGSFFRLVISP